MNYFQWFITKGWKQYIIPFALLIIIDIGVIKEFTSILDLPLLGLFIAFTSILGSNIGLIYHSIVIWKANRNG